MKMKAVEENLDENVPEPISGDVIGNTAYSERFVLKILIKFANLDSLKDEIKDKDFEEHLCILWDMTAEPDVVDFLSKHKILNIFSFALPVIESSRIIEIIIGIIANMCCQRSVVMELFNMTEFLTSILDSITSEDSLILIQVLRVVNSCLFLAEEDHIPKWMEYFESVDYSEALLFMLNNSTNKDLLSTALENLNTICSICNIEITRAKFLELFVRTQSMEALHSAILELSVSDEIEKDIYDRNLVITLQIILNLIGFENSLQTFSAVREKIVNVIELILNYNCKRIIDESIIESDLLDIVESIKTVEEDLKLSESCDMEKTFDISYELWKALDKCNQTEEWGDEQKSMEKENYLNKMKSVLCSLMIKYLRTCTSEKFQNNFEKIGVDYEEIVKNIEDKDLQKDIASKMTSLKSRLKDNVNP